MAPTLREVTHTGLKRRELIGLLEGFGVKENEIDTADQLINKFKWIPRGVSFFFQAQPVIMAYVEEREPEDEPATDAEKRLHDRFLALHPILKDFIKYILEFPELVDPLAAVVSHVAEGRNSDTSTLRTNVTSFIPANIKRDVINPPITCKSEQGFNHVMTGALLCPLKYRHRYDEDPIRFNANVNEGKFKISNKLFPSAFYPSGTVYDAASISSGLFRGHAFIRAMRAILSGKDSIQTSIRTAAKASQAEMHNLQRVTPEVVACVGTHLVFALSSVDNWGQTPKCGFDYPEFYDRILSIFTQPEDAWTKETLDFLTSQLPALRDKQTKKRKCYGRKSAEDDEDDEEDEMAIALKQRAMAGERQGQADAQPEARQVVHSEAPPTSTQQPSPRRPTQDSHEDDDDDIPVTPRPTARRRQVLHSPTPSPGGNEPQPPPSSSPPRSSPPRSDPQRPSSPIHELMGPPPLPAVTSLTALSNLTNLLQWALPRRPSFLGRSSGRERSPTLEPEPTSQPPASLITRRSTRASTAAAPSDSSSSSLPAPSASSVARGNRSTKPRKAINGYFYPSSSIAPYKRLTTFAATHSLNLRDLPVVNTATHFDNINNEPILSATVIHQKQRYLVIAFYDSTLDMNQSLLSIDAEVQWRGELAIFSIGTRVTLLSRPKGCQQAIREVVRM
ncbi:hypothetical protein BJ165DRAFT_1533498 [Panaeolus papilionaceus]|nr:hypothetical protein BJ165DRAFT_1533498 [Panaeolus papilionaceus]